MALIPPGRPLVALFREEEAEGEQEYYFRVPVVGFDEDTGEPMVILEEDKRHPRSARSVHNYVGLEFEDPPVVAALPGQGWRIEYTDDGRKWSQPIVGWLVRADGSVTVVDIDETGYVAERDTGEGDVGRIYHPDADSDLPDASRIGE
jgi:hypothetical protein